MESLNRLIMQKCVYFSFCIYIIWAVCNGLFLYYKLDYLKIPRLLVVTAYLIMIIIFSIKLFLVNSRHFTSDIYKMTWFCLLTILIQMPLVSFFLISFPLLLCTPLEVCLHVFLLLMTLAEGAISFFAVWKAVKQAAQYPPHPQYYPPVELQPVSRVREHMETRPERIFRQRHKPI